jgi:hypothetical protein
MGCAFVANSIDFLVNRCTESGEPKVVFLYCLFSEEALTSGNNVLVTLEECITQAGSTMPEDRFPCPPRTRTPIATESSCFGPSDAVSASVELQDSSPVKATFVVVESSTLRDSSGLQATIGFDNSAPVDDSSRIPDSSPVQASFLVDDSLALPMSALRASLVLDRSLITQESSIFGDSAVPRDSSRIRASSTLQVSVVFQDSLTIPAALPFSQSIIPQFTDPLNARDDGLGGKPSAGPPFLWIAIGAGLGFVLVVSIAIAIALFVRRQKSSAPGSEGSDAAPPVEASSWEVSVLPVDECVESFNPLPSSGDGNDSSGEFAGASDEAGMV